MGRKNLEVVGREVIKPAFPAPQDRLQLSSYDLSSPSVYVSTIFFYKTANGDSPEIVSRRLKASLSETLSRFYPLAGRIEGISISCNNEGAVFTEARTDLLLLDFLKNNLQDLYSLGEFHPTIAPEEFAGTWPLLSVQVSFFGSVSGVAVTVATSHKICDTASSLTFVSAWAATAKGKSKDEIMSIPPFAGTTIYPPPYNTFQSPSMDDLFMPRRKCVTNRLVFNASKIADLKHKAGSETVPIPTRVEAITSLIWRCATNASRSNSVARKSTLMIQAMDLRLRIPSDVLSRDAIGNLQSLFSLKEGPGSEMDIGKIVIEFRKAKEGFSKMIKENLDHSTTTLGQNLLSEMGNFAVEVIQDIDIYAMSSWCKKPFYEVDFGWGTPVWMGSASHTLYDNSAFVVLMDSNDGEGVEAWIGLPEQDMSVFLRDQELLAYAVLNPPVMI